MSVLVYIDQSEGQIKKSSFEAAGYASMLAAQLNTDACALILGSLKDDPSVLGNYGIKKLYHITDGAPAFQDAAACTQVLTEVCEKSGAEVIVFSNNTTAKAWAPLLSVKLKAGLVTGAVALPDLSHGFVVRKSVFSGKAFANISILTDKKIICLNANAVKTTPAPSSLEIIPTTCSSTAAKVQLEKTEKVSGEISLTEADIVVSGGRGLKGPENWGMITDLAGLLGAATACSRPVADTHWRPHHEHVGQTGIAIAPNLYIAVGISGAIQHLAGVNRSKTIVVINKDPEAPFFKAADYGIVGDAFEVMPKIIDAVRKLKSN
jgi:electron transfer flavoprotein alpha subunit